MRIVLLLFIILISTSACNKKFKEVVGISTIGPDEYQVQRSKMLEIPPHYDLPIPTHTQGVSMVQNENRVENLNEGERALMHEIE